MFYYSLFGWNVASEFEFTELFKGNENAEIDIKILHKKVPKELEGAKKSGVGFQVKPGHYQLNIGGVARFYVREGHEIWIDQKKEIDFKEVKVYLFASVLGGLCHLRNTLPLHASAVAYQGRSYLFAGNSGAGKSTIVAALQKKGMLTLNDDLSPIMFENEEAVLKQGLTRIKLWPDALEWLGEKRNKEDQIRADLEKYAHSVQEAIGVDAYPVKSLFILQPTIRGKKSSINKVEGKEKLVMLMRQTYRTQLIDGLGLQQNHFAKCGKLVQNIDLYEVVQSRLDDGLNAQLEMILDHIVSDRK
jgi:hypothetical protein